MVAAILVLFSVIAVLGISVLLAMCLLDDVRNTKEVAKVVGVVTVLGVIGAVAVIFVWACVAWFAEHAIHLV